ncbi:MAG: type II secretion system F family protein [Gemmatimonadota bacterium]|nr:type II secretion system F family protein [Gemmatimonadota bacterium]
MPTELIVLLLVVVGAAGVATYAVLAERERREVVGRTTLGAESGARAYRLLLGGGRRHAFREWLLGLAPEDWREDAKLQERLVLAGFDGPMSSVTYAALRLALMATLPMVAVLIVPKESIPRLLLTIVCALGVAMVLPRYMLERRVRQRQERLRRSLPDATDLLVLCVEAGLGLDSAILRVARETRPIHPELARELLLVTRRVNAGLARGEALRGMVTRTGLDEVRVLVQNLIQSERLGSSVGKVLRVYAETLRRRRRQIAERKASTAPLKMTFPLVILILPALFVVILGPTILSLVGLLAGRVP